MHGFKTMATKILKAGGTGRAFFMLENNLQMADDSGPVKWAKIAHKVRDQRSLPKWAHGQADF